MKRLRPILTLAVTLTFIALAPRASAEVCGAVGGQVECLDAQTLGWCDLGKLETITCPVGEICTDHEAFEGGYGCIPIADTACGDIPLEGMCTSGNSVVWCDDAGDLQLKACDDGTVCAWNEGDEWYDCLPETMSNTSRTETGDAEGLPWDTSLDTVTYDGQGGGQGLGPIPDSVLNREPDGGPTPSVSAGGESSGPIRAKSTGGCAGAPGHDLWACALGLLCLVVFRRRVTHDLHGGRTS
jgi:hypothetical protein